MIFHRRAPLALLATVILSLCSAGAAVGQTASPLEQIGWVVGGIWTAVEPGDGKTPGTTVKLTCSWGETRQAILFRASYVTEGKDTPQYDGMYIWHPGKGKIVLWQVSRKGEVAEGEASVKDGGLHQEVRVSRPDGGVHFTRSDMVRLGADSFSFRAWFKPNEAAEWVQVLDLVYRR